MYSGRSIISEEQFQEIMMPMPEVNYQERNDLLR